MTLCTAAVCTPELVGPLTAKTLPLKTQHTKFPSSCEQEIKKHEWIPHLHVGPILKAPHCASESVSTAGKTEKTQHVGSLALARINSQAEKGDVWWNFAVVSDLQGN